MRVAEHPPIDLPATQGLHVQQLGIYLDAYKHHLDLFIKATAVYLALMGGIGGYAFRQGATKWSQVALLSFAGALSVIGLFACHIARRWLVSIGSIVDGLTDQLATPRFSFDGARQTTHVIEATCLAFILAAIANVVLVLH